mgnify:CR=1 FL=1
MSMDRKAEIIGLADQLVKSVGYEGFSYADLSAKLGITKASIHHHFPHKEDLGAALCDSYEEYLAEKFSAIEAQGGGAWAKLDAYLNSGAAQVSIPILCAANLAMISPANTYPGLTKAGKGEKDEPGKYYPNNCKRNYSRVVPADDLQGAVGAAWMKELGAKKVFITHDNELYGKGLADVFREAAKKQGIAEAGYEAAAKADNFKALANKIKDSGADFVYYGGITDNNPHLLGRDLKAAAPNIKFMGPDGIAESTFVKGAGAAGEGAYITFGGIPPSEYTGKAKEWSTKDQAKYASRYNHHHRVLGGPPALTAARIRLSDAVRQVLARGLDLLGIAAPEQM